MIDRHRQGTPNNSASSLNYSGHHHHQLQQQSQSQQHRHAASSINNNTPPRFQHALEALSIQESELQELLDEEGGFAELKCSLNSRRAITNNLVKQGIHFYVKEHQSKRQRRDSSINNSITGQVSSMEDSSENINSSSADDRSGDRRRSNDDAM